MSGQDDEKWLFIDDVEQFEREVLERRGIEYQFRYRQRSIVEQWSVI